MRTLPRVLALAATAAVVVTGTPSHAREAITAPGVKPGLTYTSPVAGCSFAFLFRGSDGRDYASTAGHCALSAAGRKVWSRGDGPRVTDAAGRQIGNFVYANDVDTSDYAKTTDLAFIRLDRGLRGDPQMCAWGGPTRLLTEAVTGRTELHHNGGGLVLGDTVPSRTAYADGLPRRHRIHALGTVTFGDSGSGTTTADGSAVGINVTIEPGAGGQVGGSFGAYAMGIQRLDLAVADAAKALGVRLTLRTAPLLPTPLPVKRC